MARRNPSSGYVPRGGLSICGDDLAQEVAALPALDAAALRQKWKDLFGTEPSARLGRLFMVRAVAYQLQERTFGGLKPSTQRLLDRVCEGGANSWRKRIPNQGASAGTVLIREWGGTSHRVTVLDRGVYRGRRYKSLSEVAHLISGAHWSGPLFFGLKRRAEKIANG